MKKSLLKSALVLAAAGVGISSAYAATPTSFDPNCNNAAGFVVGLQGGYADTNWDNGTSLANATLADAAKYGLIPAQLSTDVKDTGFAARGYVGYNFNQFFGVETGYTYLPKTKINLSGFGEVAKIDTYAVDLLGKLSVPVTNVFSVYAKAGVSYLHSKGTFNIDGSSDSGSEHHYGPAFGVGAAYEVIPNLSIDASWMRFGGHTKIDENYQPSPDVYLVGASYRFSIS